MKRESPMQQLSPLTSTQWGLVTTSQAQRLGISRSSLYKLETSGKLDRVSQGVYRNTSAPSEEHEALHAAWLSLYPQKTAEERLQSAAPDAVVSSKTAAWLLGIGDFVPEPYCFSTPVRKQTQRTDIVLRLKRYVSESLTIREGLPITTVEQTIADLVAENTDFSLLSDIFITSGTDVLSSINYSYLEQLLCPYAKRYGFPSGDGKSLLHMLTAPADEQQLETIRLIQNAFKGIMQPQLEEMQKTIQAISLPAKALEIILTELKNIPSMQNDALIQAARTITNTFHSHRLPNNFSSQYHNQHGSDQSKD
ncbi:putative transcriptional regulator [Bifidobacterium saguini DSM 23967]|uniref:Type IV toxin-antitoxin system AbiEi family antitoxin domain-containing protein n=2 Tax=Bifidobacterium saguini TaxID=762210 RepID=A0ABX7S9D7_9BIFI|nr:type IV toxin-antitoxin system AbiEi family antitoxin domain-containing protein [Bifidobacterium saguini]KFI91123.1 putative transcriptional regulator [Bifidobacterium saguini DSM 23967]QTB90051.1 type IV toxin-antitoxin system AbiEi family antitoxin domain-containing protein [Bifidobacterium saguini]